MDLDLTSSHEIILETGTCVPLQARQRLSIQYVVHRDYEQVLQQLVAIMELDPAYADKYPQQAMLRIFNILGSEYPLTALYRPHLQRYLLQ